MSLKQHPHNSNFIGKLSKGNVIIFMKRESEGYGFTISVKKMYEHVSAVYRVSVP